MNHFFAQKSNEESGFLSKDDSHHALRVLRLGIGDLISVSYGDGIVYLAEISSEQKNAVSFSILKERWTQEKPQLSLAIAPTKSNDRFEIALEKTCELGVDRIFPIICDHSERKVYKQERGKRVLEAAFKQSHKGYMPELKECLSFKALLELGLSFPQKYIAALSDDYPSKKISSLNLYEPSLVLIGPEGDFSKSEIELAREAGFELISLGSEVLRTETAAILVSALANAQRDFRSAKKS